MAAFKFQVSTKHCG